MYQSTHEIIMNKPSIGIIITSTREGRFGERVAQWFQSLAAPRSDLRAEIVDLRDYPLPFFDMPTALTSSETAAVRAWGSKIASLDGYVFITAEYNRAITGVLKNALDHIRLEPARKPAAFVGYGSVGGSRAIEQLRLTTVELAIVPTKSGVHINMEPFLGLQGGKSFEDYPYLADTANTLLDELAWFAATLRAGREAVEHRSAA